MKRREFITLLGGAAAWPFAAHAQQRALPVIGLLGNGDQGKDALAAFRSGLKDAGYVEGRNMIIEYSSVHGEYDRLRELAAELVQRKVSVIFTTAPTNSVRAAKAATSTIPIVFVTGGDPVKLGFVASLNHPGGNVTGVTYFTSELTPKRLELVRELVPGVATIAVLSNPASTRTKSDESSIEEAAHSMGQRIIILHASTTEEIDTAFSIMVQQRIGALLISGDAFFTSHRDQIATLAARNLIPAVYNNYLYVVAGGLMSYGDDRLESQRQGAYYVGRVLKGEKPADLPVLQPTKFQFVINLKAAKALGLTVPLSILLRADEVIE
jgi:putative ABC transport system substrate-binding protein